ncbi:hypothetical protein LEM8419_03552 [Neolewinella maritima]|uniref:Uncharacterized protein n=1 Tax=Neolewinella maritima TaxID=1383882 RepID=A0ABN8FEM0_9BACT|nr:hypothetical protein [Neolewinella maritima]CAH1002680.1 hypothetical protein LEM8419_03552 [Neolewinella maritima]
MLLLDEQSGKAIEGLTESYMQMLARANPARYQLAEEEKPKQAATKKATKEDPPADPEPTPADTQDAPEDKPAPKKRGRRPNRTKTTKSE